jgi:hypothetical protein
LLKKIDPDLYEIPWARTGKRYLKDDDMPDSLEKRYHNYGKWCRNEIRDYITELIFNGDIKRLSVFNMRQIKIMNKFNQFFSKQLDNNWLDEIFLWLASFSILIKKYNCNISEKIVEDKKVSFCGIIQLFRYYKRNVVGKIIYIIMGK